MKIKEGFILRKIAGDDVVIPIGENIANFNGAITLNETAASLWKCLESGSTREELMLNLCKEYDVPEEKAYIDIDKFLGILKEHGILEGEQER